MAQTEPAGGPYRAAVRWGVLLAGVVTAAMRVPELHRFWAQWHALEAGEAQAAAAYERYFAVEGAITVFILAMAAGLFYALRPRGKQAE